MQRFVSQQFVPCGVEEVFRFFADPRNLPRISPPGVRLEQLRMVAPIAAKVAESGALDTSAAQSHPAVLAGSGSRILISFPIVPGLWRGQWLAEIAEFDYPRFFRDVQVRGPFRYWSHRHMFQPEVRSGQRGTQLIDDVEYEFGRGLLGKLADSTALRWQLRAMFAHRHKATAAVFAGL